MTYIYMEFKGKNNRKYKIRRFNDEAYQFWESGRWQFEMKGKWALEQMIQDIGRKGGKLVKAFNSGETISITSKGE